MTSRMAIVGACALMALIGDASQADAANALEKAIARLQPCHPLKIDMGIAKIGIDRTANVTVQSATITIQGNMATAEANASLTCEASDKSPLSGDASATFSVAATMDLETCAVGNSELSILKTGGKYGKLVEEFKDGITATIKSGLEKQLMKLCQ
jgi:hypothetical protein